MSSQSQEDSIKEGKQREEILFSFKVIGISEIALGILLVMFGILTVIFAGRNYFPLSFSGCGIWGGLFSIPAGILSITTYNKVTYFSVGWSLISSVIGSFFSLLICSLSLGGAVECIERRINEVFAFSLLLFTFGIAQLVLCTYSSVVFGRLFWSYPHHVRSQDFLCPCLSMRRNQSNFANVMYSTISAKKHDY